MARPREIPGERTTTLLVRLADPDDLETLDEIAREHQLGDRRGGRGVAVRWLIERWREERDAGWRCPACGRPGALLRTCRCGEPILPPEAE